MKWEDPTILDELREYGYEPLPEDEEFTFEEVLAKQTEYGFAYIRRGRARLRRQLGCTCDAPMT